MRTVKFKNGLVADRETETKTLARLFESNQIFLIKEDEIVEANVIPSVRYAEADKKAEFEKEYNLKIKDNTTLNDLKEKIEAIKVKELYAKIEAENDDDSPLDDLKDLISEEVEEILEDFLENFDCLPQICWGNNCEDVVEKSDIEDLEKENVLFYDDVEEKFYETVSDWSEFSECFTWYDGRNWCIEWIEHRETYDVEMIDYEKGNTFEIKTYKNEDVEFQVFNSFYKDALPFVDTDYKGTKLEDF